MKKKETVASQIANEIAMRIAKRMLHPNQHLVELAIAEEFKTSRAPVREALLMLEKDRLVEKIPHRGFVVRQFSKSEIHQLYDATFRLEEIAMQKAIHNVTQSDIAALEDILEKQREAIGNNDTVSYYDFNEQFHAYILFIAGNQFITEMHQSLRRSSRPLSLLNMGQGNNMSLSYEEHTRQFRALQTKDLSSGIQAIRDQEARSLKTLDIFYPE
ncbi:GntR family transcriptional regulator [Alicyclobacillus kakegawensis]|uniref:GntR family transcriptional regulator n=1 Tax=Alicyclobacillus kakegawensis TaxID=392012 RepID=UPI00082A2B4F|nr:GntR family transcriptional regulator [Alicyclobacillus kakegawensis]